MRLFRVDGPPGHHLLIFLNFENVMKVVENLVFPILRPVYVIDQIVPELNNVVAEVNVAVDDRTVA